MQPVISILTVKQPPNLFTGNLTLQLIMSKIRIYRQFIFAVALLAILLLSVLVFGQDEAKPVKNPDFDFWKIFGMGTAVVGAIGGVVTLIHFYWKGKNKSQTEEDLRQADARANRLAAEKADLDAKITKMLAYINAQRRGRRQDRKLIHILTAKKEGIEVDEDIHESDITDLDAFLEEI